MDADHLDTLSRHLYVRATRRGASALGAVLVAALALPEAGDAQVQAELCLKPGLRCKKKQGKHRQKMRCCGQARCRKGRCRCKPGFQTCQGKCISSTECCGGCAAGQECVSGQCTGCGICPTGQECVNGQCTGCGICPVGQTCVGDRCVGCGQGGDCTVFTTSLRYTGLLGPLTSADGLCQQRANVAGLSGTYMAWLSTDTESPATRFTQNPGRYVRSDGVPVAANWGELVSGVLLTNLDRTETGEYIASEQEAWTNTAADGKPYSTDANLSCSMWNSSSAEHNGRTGKTDQADEDWTSSLNGTCNIERRLYCFQQS